MKAVGLDTCVVLRLLIGEPEDLAEASRRFVEGAYARRTRICVSDLVVAETYHALIYHYEVPKLEAVAALRAFLESPGIHPTGQALVALTEYRGTGAGLVDRLIRLDLLSHVAEVCTFDKDFAKLGNVRKL